MIGSRVRPVVGTAAPLVPRTQRADRENEQIGEFADNPAPGFDTGGKRLDRPLRETVERIFYDRPPTDSSSR